jgi:hypothetical protein
VGIPRGPAVRPTLRLRRKLSAISYSGGVESSHAAKNLMDSNTKQDLLEAAS